MDKILVIDDGWKTTKLLIRKLRKSGFEVVVAESISVADKLIPRDSKTQPFKAVVAEATPDHFSQGNVLTWFLSRMSKNLYIIFFTFENKVEVPLEVKHMVQVVNRLQGSAAVVSAIRALPK